MRKLLAGLVFLVLSSGVARAGPAPRAHDGFFLQLDLGGGSLKTEAPTFLGDMELSGTAGEFGVLLGGAVRENLILAGHLWGVSARDPDGKLDGQDVGSLNGSTTLTGFGVNLTYYVMPVNVYLSVSPSITQLSLDPDDGDAGETENGFGMRFAVGKEWFLSDNFGLGLNAQFAFASNKDKGTDPPTWKSRWFGVALSATFN